MSYRLPEPWTDAPGQQVTDRRAGAGPLQYRAFDGRESYRSTRRPPNVHPPTRHSSY